MPRSPRTLALLVALTALIVSLSPAAFADSGTIRLTVLKAGWIIGGSGGSGTLTFKGKRYRLGVGGLSIGFTFGGAKAVLSGTVSNIRRPSDVAGVYAAVGAGAALGAGAQVIRLQNEKGAVLELSGQQVGLQINLDLSGLTIALR